MGNHEEEEDEDREATDQKAAEKTDPVSSSPLGDRVATISFSGSENKNVILGKRLYTANMEVSCLDIGKHTSNDDSPEFLSISVFQCTVDPSAPLESHIVKAYSPSDSIEMNIVVSKHDREKLFPNVMGTAPTDEYTLCEHIAK